LFSKRSPQFTSAKASCAFHFGNGNVDMYGIKDGQLEFFTCRSQSPTWYPLTPEEILQHVVLHTPVAVWLHVRLRLQAVDVIHPSQSLEEMRGVAMVTDPVCGIEEIDVPESLQSKCEGKIYYFCSHECKSEFDQNRRRSARAA
jgi:YHS domain-containing protein